MQKILEFSGLTVLATGHVVVFRFANNLQATEGDWRAKQIAQNILAQKPSTVFWAEEEGIELRVACASEGIAFQIRDVTKNNDIVAEATLSLDEATKVARVILDRFPDPV